LFFSFIGRVNERRLFDTRRPQTLNQQNDFHLSAPRLLGSR
jgi:hypothetical protein